jgi:uncharacterized protein YciI
MPTDPPALKRILVVTRRQPTFDPSVVPAHYAFLDELRSQGRLELAGPFSDKSGGAYIILAEDLSAGAAIAHRDPVHTTGSSILSIHEWSAK